MFNGYLDYTIPTNHNCNAYATINQLNPNSTNNEPTIPIINHQEMPTGQGTHKHRGRPSQVVVAKSFAPGLRCVSTGPRHHGRVVVDAELPVLGLGDVAMWPLGCTVMGS